MRKLMALVAVLGLAATPAFAGLTPSSYSPVQANLTHTGGHTVGIYGYFTGYGPGIYSNISFYPTGTATYSVSFAFHWPYSTPVTGIQMWSQLGWDNDEIQIMNVSAPMNGGSAGLFGWNNTTALNYPTGSFWSGATLTGTIVVGDVYGTGTPLWANPAFTTAWITGSGIYPFMKVDFRSRGASDNAGFLDLFIGEAALLFDVSGVGHYWTGGAINSTSYGINVLPEPASLSLLAIGLATTGFGVWRRRR